MGIDCKIDIDGAKAVSELLETNTGLTVLSLSGKVGK